jgi:pimeloyl-ACP methyl ester carboxylesterase
MSYQFAQYAADLGLLIQALNAAHAIERLDWIGTSMGGVVGMLLAAQALPVPVHHLVLNDIGPVVSWPAILKMQNYVGQVGQFQTVQEAANDLWQISNSFGHHTSEEWLALSKHMVRTFENDRLSLHYDPAIGIPVKSRYPSAS